jgi:hypothetical protein
MDTKDNSSQLISSILLRNSWSRTYFSTWPVTKAIERSTRRSASAGFQAQVTLGTCDLIFSNGRMTKLMLREWPAVLTRIVTCGGKTLSTLGSGENACRKMGRSSNRT